MRRPTWVIRPSWSRATRSASITVEARWATTNPVVVASTRLQRLLDQLLGVHVQGRQGVVEDQDLGLGEHGTGQGEALPLPAGQGDPLLADPGVEAPRQVVDEPGLLDLECLVDLLVGGRRSRDPDRA